MKRERLCILLVAIAGLLILQYPVHGQPNRDLDSLLEVVHKLPIGKKVEALLEISNHYQSVSQTQAITYGLLALEEARKSTDAGLLARAYKNVGNTYLISGDLSNVINYYDSSEAIFRNLGDSLSLSKIWNNLGIAYNGLGDYNQSLKYHLNALEMKKELGDTISLISSYVNIGSLYFALENFDKSAEYYRQGLYFSQQKKLTHKIAAINNNLGLISQEINNYKVAEQYFRKSLELNAKSGDLISQANLLHNLGRNYFLTQQYDQAKESYSNALELYSKAGVQNSVTWNNLGQLYLDLDYYKQAADLFYKAETMAKSNNQLTSLRDIYLNSSILYSRKGDYKQAYNYHVLFKQIDDSLAKFKQVNDLILKERSEKIADKKREQENKRLQMARQEVLQKKQDLFIYLILGGLIVLVIIAFVLLRLYQVKKKANKVLYQQNDEVLRSQSIIKKINRALSDSEDKLRSIFDVSPFAILVLNSDMKILDCNDTSIITFDAKDKRELLGKPFPGFLQTTGINSESHDIVGLVNRKALNRRVYEIKHVGGSTFTAELTGRKITDSTSGTDNFIIVVTDITERLRFIQSLKEAKLKAEESDVLKTAFLTNMSHEIRTPMNSIVGFSNLLLDTNLSKELREQYLAYILQSSHILMKLIDDIIDIAKIEAGQLSNNPETTEPVEIIRDAFKIFSDSNKKKGLAYKFNSQVEDQNIQAFIDPLRLKQILMNLLNNALKFTAEGSIEVGVKLEKGSSTPELLVYVKDTGIGIPENKLDMIFERFRQVDDSRTRNFGGTGLGLSISKNLVELMKGRIWVESEVSVGSTFYFSIPCKTDEFDVSIKHNQNEKREKFWRNKRILVAEDENSNFELIKATLLKTGIEILRATNGAEAIEKVKEFPDIDLILMDIRMPRLNGYEATRKIKSIRPELPVISITAYAMSEDEAKSREAGCDRYLSKPIKPKDLIKAMGVFLGGNGVLKKSSAEV